MTAPGQEPDEVLTATPGGKGPAADTPDLGAIGDNHMPEDLRRAARGETDEEAEAGEADRRREPADSPTDAERTTKRTGESD